MCPDPQAGSLGASVGKGHLKFSTLKTQLACDCIQSDPRFAQTSEAGFSLPLFLAAIPVARPLSGAWVPESERPGVGP